MSDHKGEIKDGRTKEIIRKIASEYIARESNHASLITITEVNFSYEDNRALIMISVLPEHKTPAVVDFLNRRRNDIREYIMKNSRIGRVPFFSFENDLGEKNRQKIDLLSIEASKLDKRD